MNHYHDGCRTPDPDLPSGYRECSMVPCVAMLESPMRVFIGYDPRQPLAYTICQHSILRHATGRVQIEPLMLTHMPMKRRGLTDFTYTRWLVPWLCDYRGDALFIDPDTIVRGDVTEIRRITDVGMAATVVQGKLKFEWASLIYFQCGSSACRTLTPEYVANEANHPSTFSWVPDGRLGALPAEWNHLVLYDEPNPAAKIIHYTAGIPCWPETAACDAAALWHAEVKAALATVSWEELMGQSVHKAAVEGLNKKVAV